MPIPSINLKVAARIKHLRAKHDYTQEALAEKADMSPQHIQRLEGKNPSGSSIATISKIAAAFGITLSQFFEEL